MKRVHEMLYINEFKKKKFTDFLSILKRDFRSSYFFSEPSRYQNSVVKTVVIAGKKYGFNSSKDGCRKSTCPTHL